MGQVLEKIAAEIRDRGAIGFARFMELALYCPVYGYYEKERDIGRRGDYYTSVSVGPLFGELLACQFARWLEGSGAGRPECQGSAVECHGEGQEKQPRLTAERLQLVEAGAHRGELARDILRWLRAQRPALFERLRYSIIEPSPARRDWQQQTLQVFGCKVSWSSSFSELAEETRGGAAGLDGIIFSNELLDAMPVHRLGWDACRRAWFEWGVTLDGGELVWTRLGEVHSPQSTVHSRGTEVQSPKSKVQSHGAEMGNAKAEGLRRPEVRSPKSEAQTPDDAVHTGEGGLFGQPPFRNPQSALPTPKAPHSALRIPQVPEALLEVLPDGFTIEVSPAAVEWWSQAAGALASGKLLTIDYGLATEEQFSPARAQGTLRGYRQHQLVQDVLADPGEQDITAHVNFSALRETGEACGLKTERFCSQAQWLTEIAGEVWRGGRPFAKWTSGYTRQFQTLTHPDHLGCRFGVLVQSR